jgi:hypothetical protein
VALMLDFDDAVGRVERAIMRYCKLILRLWG